jgi:hypothetical protein
LNRFAKSTKKSTKSNDNSNSNANPTNNHNNNNIPSKLMFNDNVVHNNNGSMIIDSGRSSKVKITRGKQGQKAALNP